MADHVSAEFAYVATNKEPLNSVSATLVYIPITMATMAYTSAQMAYVVTTPPRDYLSSQMAYIVMGPEGGYVQVGTSPDDLLKMVVRWPGYMSGAVAIHQQGPDLSGSIVYAPGVTPRVWSGEAEIYVSPPAGYATLEQIRTIWETRAFIYFIDSVWNAYTDTPFIAKRVIWQSPFTISWESSEARWGVLPFTLIEVQA